MKIPFHSPVPRLNSVQKLGNQDGHLLENVLDLDDHTEKLKTVNSLAGLLPASTLHPHPQPHVQSAGSLIITAYRVLQELVPSFSLLKFH